MMYMHFNEHVARINHLAATSKTYTVRSGKTSTNWEVIFEHVDLQCVKTCRREFLGIHNVQLRERISSNAPPLAELILQLMYNDGQWRLFLGTMKRQ